MIATAPTTTGMPQQRATVLFTLFVYLATAFIAGNLVAAPSFDRGVVAADHIIASRAGAEILAKGGNAVDAAVATSFCLSVVRPMSCGLGGGGFMLIHRPGDKNNQPVSVAFNYREQAPAVVSEDYFQKLTDPLASRFTGSAVGVPGFVAGLAQAHKQFGSLSWSELLKPAIAAAQNGFAVNESYMKTASSLIPWFNADPTRKTRFSFVWSRFLRDGAVSVGDVIRNPEQARALKLIAEQGADAFYKGPIAQAIATAVKNSGGVLTQSDLASYSVQQLKPLVGEFHNQQVLTMPPPSSGGVATLQVLGILERYEQLHDTSLANLGLNSAPYMHVVAEAFKHAFADRAQWLGDADFADVPVDRLLSPDYLDDLAGRIDPSHTIKGDRYGSRTLAPAPPNDAGTSHFSIIDANGMAVASTNTINLSFGSRIAVDEFGFCLNNEMDDFTTVPGAINAFGLRQSSRNLPAPGKRPLSSMSPTIVLDKDGNVELITGAAGGPRIITGTIQTLFNVMVFGLSATDAVATPRFHHQWFPNVLALEPAWDRSPGISTNPSTAEMFKMMNSVSTNHDFRAVLKSYGHRLGSVHDVGVVQLIRRTAHGYEAASDPRRGGTPAGVDKNGKVTPSSD